VTVLSDKIILLLYGSEFVKAADTLRILIWTMVFFPIANILGNGLIASHHQKIDLLVNSLGAVFNIALNAVLIPKYGPLGASIATVSSILFFLVIQNLFVFKKLFIIPYMKILPKPLLAAFTMITSIFLLKNWNFYMSITIGFILYGVVLFMIRIFSHDELQLIKHIWQERKHLFGVKGV
jgi:O-antigen/teichoic acid export membrane protein